MQKIGSLIIRVEEYVREADDNVSRKELINHFHSSEGLINEAVAVLIGKDVLFEHKDKTLTLNNPDLVSDRPDLIRLY